MVAPTPPPPLSVVVPAFNEASRIGPTLARIGAYLDERMPRAEILVVDDGSLDETVAVARQALAERAGARVIELGTNRGKGAAVRAGVLATEGELVLFSDADLATPIEELEKLLDRLADGAEVVIASRALPGAELIKRQHYVRELMGRTFNRFVRLLGVPGFGDTQCGFKLFTRAAALDLFGRSTVDGFAFDVEILVLARGRYRVVEVPVVWRHVEESRVSPWRDAPRMLLDLVRIRLRHRGGSSAGGSGR